MVTLTRIYTRGGDAGLTSLSDGSRVTKHSPRPEAFGNVDEANATIGLVRLHVPKDSAEDTLLSRIQNDLFDLGADLATPAADAPKYPPLRIVESQVQALEAAIDHYNADLAPLSSFVLPGGSAASSYLHLARTVTRRAERAITEMMDADQVNPEALKYCNRLSDLLFVLARWFNDRGEHDVLWVPGANR